MKKGNSEKTQSTKGKGTLGAVKALITKYREITMYIIFGGLTTVVDWAVSFLLYKTALNVHVTNVIAWLAAVIFAFVTNKIFVFESDRKGKLLLAELCSFAGGRVFSLGVQELIFLIFSDIMKLSDYYVKIGSSVIVVIINYIIGKLIFKNKK